MSRLILIRHCASAGQWPDAPLTEAGAAAAEALAERLAGLDPDAVYSSPYRRALNTLAPFAALAGLPMTVDARLKERVLADRDLDDWLDEIRRSFADPDRRASGGESLNDSQARALDALGEIAGRGHRLPVVASHGGVISAVLRAADPTFGFEDWRGLKNPDLFELSLPGGRLAGWRRLD